ncbi:MAG: hypothetical protein AVDCRST_MAG18-4287 [uncultured Thermomicrobiales bacterium]|uniref:Uncharacterized protein n=1 Tax=uncultured Thermomicrobiales bacterium TaxID=1645740 RepID=A0A6J4VWS7_9BACT|nr:MAG: hypothetical protein AVDCRST_MAG18-4287 [uncultured Thermomicrobiales bacterium]
MAAIERNLTDAILGTQRHFIYRTGRPPVSWLAPSPGK